MALACTNVACGIVACNIVACQNAASIILLWLVLLLLVVAVACDIVACGCCIHNFGSFCSGCGLYYCTIVVVASDGDIACKSNTATDHCANNQTKQNKTKLDLND